MSKKTIDTLVADIENVIKGGGGWTEEINEYFMKNIGEAATRRLSLSSKEPRKPTLRMSNIGNPCRRKLWYDLHHEGEREELPAHTLLKFFFGDILEILLLSLAKAAGHTVEGEQDTIVVDGIVGHRDAVIDGMNVDVKSASSMAFNKFKRNELRIDDPFGYLTQLTGYVKGSEEDPIVTDKTHGAFLAVDKQHGHIVLDTYDLSPELHTIEDTVNEVRACSKFPVPPPRRFEPVPEGKSGNMKLDTQCSYCSFKKECFPELRTFLYSKGPVFLTKVVKEPNVHEVT